MVKNLKLKHLGIILIFLLAVGTAAAVDINDISEDDFKNITFQDNDTQITVDGYDFTIPKGYGAVEKLNANETDDDGVTQVFRFFADENENVIMVSVLSGNVSLDLDDYSSLGGNPQNITIAGHDGTLFERNGYWFFVYVDGEGVIILQAPYPGTIENMMK